MAKETPRLDDLLTLEAAASKLGITRDALYKRVYRRHIPVYRMGNLMMIDAKDLVASLEYQPAKKAKL